VEGWLQVSRYKMKEDAEINWVVVTDESLI